MALSSTLANMEGTVAVSAAQPTCPLVSAVRWASPTNATHQIQHCGAFGMRWVTGGDASSSYHSFLGSGADRSPPFPWKPEEWVGKGVHQDSKCEEHLPTRASSKTHFDDSKEFGLMAPEVWDTNGVCAAFYLLERIVWGRCRVKRMSPVGLSLNPSPVGCVIWGIWFPQLSLFSPWEIPCRTVNIRVNVCQDSSRAPGI